MSRGRYPRTDSYTQTATFIFKDLDGLNNIEGSSLVSEICNNFRIGPSTRPSCEKTLKKRIP